MNWNGHAKYYDWEFDLICTNQKEDIRLWKALADEFGDPILEMCCGSGRITKELAKEGYNITAIDNSSQMLNSLRNKSLKSVEVINADIRDFDLGKKFKFAFISYSSFQQLLTLKDQLNCLNAIYEHLENEGILAMDINPRICTGPEVLPRTHSYTSEYFDDSTVTMYTSHKIDRINQIKHWKDEYLKVDKNGNELHTFVDISLKECSVDLIKLLFEKSKFEILNIYGDFDKGKVTSESNNLIYVVRKI